MQLKDFRRLNRVINQFAAAVILLRSKAADDYESRKER